MRHVLTKRSTWFAAIGVAAVLATVGLARESQAGDHGFRIHFSGDFGGHHHGYGGRRVWGGGGRPWAGSFYHGPSVHHDALWHHEYDHWTPRRGWHGHGHYDFVPHYVPGHFDYHHFNHVDPQPWYHH